MGAGQSNESMSERYWPKILNGKSPDGSNKTIGALPDTSDGVPHEMNAIPNVPLKVHAAARCWSGNYGPNPHKFHAIMSGLVYPGTRYRVDPNPPTRGFVHVDVVKPQKVYLLSKEAHEMIKSNWRCELVMDNPCEPKPLYPGRLITSGVTEPNIPVSIYSATPLLNDIQKQLLTPPRVSLGSEDVHALDSKSLVLLAGLNEE